MLVNGSLYGPDNPVGTEVIPGGAANGADSIIEVRLVFYQPGLLEVKQPICEGDTLWFNNTAYHDNFYLGEELIEGGAANGCDSIIQIELTPYSEGHLLLDHVICGGDSIIVNGVVYDAFNTSGTEVISGGAANGYCDSIIQINLIPVTESYAVIQDTLCPDSVLIVNGNQYDHNNPVGREILQGSSSFGCDSIVDINLTFWDIRLDIGLDREISIGDTVCIDPVLNFSPVAIEWTPSLPCADLSLPAPL